MTRAPGQAQPAAAAAELPALPEQARPLAQLRADAAQADAAPANNDAPAASAAQPTVTDYYYEDFEGNWTNPNDPKNIWRLYDYSNYGGLYMWGKRTCSAIQGSFAAFSAGGGNLGGQRLCNSDYPNSWYGAATAGPLDFGQYIRGTLTYFVRGNSEWSHSSNGCDYNQDDVLFVGTGTDINKLYGSGWCGDFSDQYYSDSIDLTTVKYPVLGKHNVYLSLEFSSDDDNNLGWGFAVDYVVLALERPVSTAPNPSTIYIPNITKASPVLQLPKCKDPEPANNASAGSGVYSTFGQFCEGSLLQNDSLDWYKFTVAAGKNVVIDLANLPSKADYDIYIFNAALKDVAKGVKGAGQDERVTFTSQNGGVYYARVSVAGANTAPYTYDLRISTN